MLTSTFGSQSTAEVNGSVEIMNGPSDSISDLAVSSPNNNEYLLAASSWEGSIKVWKVTENLGNLENPAVQYLTEFKQPKSVLCCAISSDGSSLIAGGLAKELIMYKISTQQTATLCTTDSPIGYCNMDSNRNLIFLITLSGEFIVINSLDGTRMQSHRMPGLFYAAEVEYPVFLYADEMRTVRVYNLESPLRPTEPQYTFRMSFKTSITCLKTLKNQRGFIAGSLEGRAFYQPFSQTATQKSFSWTLHSEKSGSKRIYAVHDIISFMANNPYIATCGGDGTVCFWDMNNRRLHSTWKGTAQPITKMILSPTGNSMIYCEGYDWAFGVDREKMKRSPGKLFAHFVKKEFRCQ